MVSDPSCPTCAFGPRTSVLADASPGLVALSHPDKNGALTRGGWSLDNLRAFVKSLLGQVSAFNPSELFALAMQAGAFADKDSRPFVMTISTGKFSMGELEKFAEGKPSPVDQFAAQKDLTLEIVDARSQDLKPDLAADPFALPCAPEPLDAGERVNVDVSREVDATGVGAAGWAMSFMRGPMTRQEIRSARAG